MRNSRYCSLFLFFVAAAFAATVQVTGRVERDGHPVDRMMVELSSPTRATAAARAMTSLDGSFDLRGITPGDYQVRVTDLHGNAIHERFVSVGMGGEMLTITIPPPKGSKPLTGTVSAKALAVKVPSKAKKLFAKAAKQSTSGDHEGSAALLQEALQLAPEVPGAWCNLAVQQLYLSDIAGAEQSLTKALELGGEHAMVYTNRAYARIRLNRPDEAADDARRAVRLDPSYLRGHYMLGVILMPDPKHAEEAMRHLEAAQDSVPRAHVQLAELYARQGNQKAAERELKEYLDTGATEMRPQIEQWMSRMRSR